MNSTPGAKSKLGYMHHGQSRDKPKDSHDASVEKAKVVIGSDFTDLFSHMNKDNLNYISSQIKEKEKEKRRTNKKPDIEEKQLGIINIEPPEVLQSSLPLVDHPIIEIDASQEETQRSQESHPIIRDEKPSEMKFEELESPQSSDRLHEDPNQPTFIEFLDNYISSLSELPPPPSKEKSARIQKDYHFARPPSRFKPPSLDENKLYEAIRVLQRKQNKQRMDGSILQSQLEDCHKKEEEQREYMIRLEERMGLLTRDIQKLKRQQNKQLKKRDLIREVILSDNHNRSSSTTMYPRMISRELERSAMDVNEEYENYKYSTHRYRKN